MNRRYVRIFAALPMALLSSTVLMKSGHAQESGPPAVPTNPAQTPPPTAIAPPAAPADDLLGLTGPSYPTRTFAGFGDIDYSTAHYSPSGRQFTLGQLTLQLTSALSPKTFIFTEGTMTARSDAGAGSPPAPAYNAQVERLFLRYDVDDALKISAGKYHTPINWWNTAFHHGLWLQTTIARPEMVKFGGQFIPVHFVGLQLEGGVPANGLNVYYNAGLGNGRSAVVSEDGDAGDDNDVPAELINVFVRPDRLYGVEVGAAAYIDNVPVTVTTPATTSDSIQTSTYGVHETILSGHIVYQKENPEFIAEYAHIEHSAAGTPETNNDAYYVQVAYRRPGGLFKPYYRYERMRVANGDLVLTETPSLTGNTVGVRYDFTELAALKLEYRNMQRSPSSEPYGQSTTGAFAQVSFAF